MEKSKWEWDDRRKVFVQKGFKVESLDYEKGSDKFGDVIPKKSYSPLTVRWNNTFEMAQQFRFIIALSWIKNHFTKIHKNSKRRKTIIDFGCSRSVVYQRWRNNMNYFNCPKIYYCGFDSNFKRISQGRELYAKKKNDKVEYFLGNMASPLSFPVKADVIVAMEILEHLDPERVDIFFKNIYNNLRKDGIGIISSPNPKQGEDWTWSDSSKGHWKEYSWDIASNLIKDNGFTVLDRIGVLPSRNYFKKTSFPKLRKRLVEHLPSSFVNPILMFAEKDMSMNREWICKVVKRKK